VVFPSNKAAQRKKVAYGAQERESGLSAVLLRPCGLLALIPVNEKKTKSGAKFGLKMAAVAALGSPGGDPSKLKAPFSRFYRPLCRF
jgi:hypothetical protein